MEYQNVRSGETDKPAFVTSSKSNVDEHRVQLTLIEAVKRSSTFKDFNSKNMNAFSKDWHDHNSKSNPNIVSNFNISILVSKFCHAIWYLFFTHIL